MTAKIQFLPREPTLEEKNKQIIKRKLDLLKKIQDHEKNIQKADRFCS